MIAQQKNELGTYNVFLHAFYKKERDTILALTVFAVLIPVIATLYLFHADIALTIDKVVFLVLLLAIILYDGLVRQLRSARYLLNSTVSEEQNTERTVVFDRQKMDDLALHYVTRFAGVIACFCYLVPDVLLHLSSSSFKLAIMIGVVLFYGLYMLYYPLRVHSARREILNYLEQLCACSPGNGRSAPGNRDCKVDGNEGT